MLDDLALAVAVVIALQTAGARLLCEDGGLVYESQRRVARPSAAPRDDLGLCERRAVVDWQRADIDDVNCLSGAGAQG